MGNALTNKVAMDLVLSGRVAALKSRPPPNPGNQPGLTLLTLPALTSIG